MLTLHKNTSMTLRAINRAQYPAKLLLQPKSTIFSQSKASDHGPEGEGSDSFKSLKESLVSR